MYRIPGKQRHSKAKGNIRAKYDSTANPNKEPSVTRSAFLF